jgi:hypothetical protein
MRKLWRDVKVSESRRSRTSGLASGSAVKNACSSPSERTHTSEEARKPLPTAVWYMGSNASQDSTLANSSCITRMNRMNTR